MNGLLAGRRTAVDIMMVSSAPAAAAKRIAMPRINAVPMASRAVMNSTSARPVPAMEW
jgi:hypothetical protein